MNKKPFVTLDKVREIAKEYPTPFHLYDEKVSELMHRLLKTHLHGTKDIRSILQ